MQELEHPPYRVEQGTEVDLAARDPRDGSWFGGDKSASQRSLMRLTKRLGGLQELLYADGRHKLLVVLQATDTGGKDGTVRSVFRHVNPVGVRVAAFKKPSTVELAHDYLWRVHQQTPGTAELVIFNRSHYEDVLIVRVRELVPRSVWEQRYAQIAEFEKRLVEEGTTIVKFFLHISKDEQRRRLQARLDTPTKHWKFSSADLAERALWDDYVAAYDAALSRTSTEEAPWYVVPADRKWYRNLVVAKVLVDTLERLGMKYPGLDPDAAGVVIE